MRNDMNSIKLREREEERVRRVSKIEEECKEENVSIMSKQETKTLYTGQSNQQVSPATSPDKLCHSAIKKNTLDRMKVTGKKTIERKLSSGSRRTLKSEEVRPTFIQSMFEITSLQYKSNRRYIKPHTAQRIGQNCRLKAPTLMFIVSVTLAILISTIIIKTQALSSSNNDASLSASVPSSNSPSSGNSITASLISAIVEQSGSSGGKQQSASERSSNVEGDSSSNTPKSVVASLSSAVASAAAAAAVAAAQNTLSGGDGRSLISGSHRHHQQARSPSPLNLALKIADSIPEVPYHILHNMKKIDHAAPFYNVGLNNKISSGSSKESSHSLLSSALSAGGFSAEQLSSIFRSPIWKRIADGYGEFTSEFRSLFKVPTQKKGPLSPTTKLLRDISVPALLMLAASAIPTDWHPVRTRRKSLSQPEGVPQPSIVSAAASIVDPMTASATGVDLPNFSIMPQLLGARASSLGDINLQAQPVSSDNTWLLSQHQPAVVGTSQQLMLSARNQPHSMAHVEQTFQQQQQVGGQQQPTRRFGDIRSGVGLQRSLKPVNSDSSQSASGALNQASVPSLASQGGFLGSLTSSGQTYSANRIMNANANNASTNTKTIAPLSSDNSAQESQRKLLEERQDLVNDKYRYSLVGLNNANENVLSHGGAQSEHSSQKLSPPSSKPFLLSAMTQALTSMMLNQQQQHLESGSSSSFPSQQIYFGGDKAILSRRQQSPSNGVEQRDLSQFLPQTWRELAKRTMNSVQQQASTQWKSIEGQLSTWVQDKLKILPAPQTSSTPTTSSSSSLAQPAAPSSSGGSTGSTSAGGSSSVTNIIASVKDTALNILGLTTKSSAQTASNPPLSGSHDSSSSDANKSGKNDSPNRSSGTQTVNSKLAGIANMIVSTITSNRHSPSSSPTASTKSSGTGSEISSPSSSQYPTLKGADSTVSSAMAAGTASTVAGLSTHAA